MSSILAATLLKTKKTSIIKQTKSMYNETTHAWQMWQWEWLFVNLVMFGFKEPFEKK
jgi:hypothetical protein